MIEEDNEAHVAYDRTHHGQKLQAPPGFDGPVAHRHCTDIIFLLLFVAHAVALTALGWVALGWIPSEAIGVGKPQILLHGLDHSGAVCGIDDRVASRPYLYFPNPTGDPSRFTVAAGDDVGRSVATRYALCLARCPTNSTSRVVDWRAASGDTGNSSGASNNEPNEWHSYATVAYLWFCVPNPAADGLGAAALDLVNPSGRAAMLEVKGSARG